MYSMKEIFGVASVKGEVEKRTQTVVFESTDDSNAVSENINSIISESKHMNGVPDYASIITIHSDKSGKVVSAKITIKTRNADRIAGNNLCSSYVIPYLNNFKSSLVSFIAEWIDSYFITKKAQKNVDELNGVVGDMCGAVDIKFALSDNTVVAISNSSIVLGLSAEAAAKIESLQIFSDNDMIKNIRRNALEAEIQSFTNACEVIKCKTGFFKTLDIYTRNGVSGVLKKVYKKDITRDVKNREVCRFEYKDNVGKYLGLIEKAKNDSVCESEAPILVKGNYSYFVVLSPFGKSDDGIVSLSDSDTAVILDSVV